MDSQTAELLQGLIRRTGRSLLQYAGDAVPWTTPQGEKKLERLRQMIDEERDAIAALARLLRKHRIAPPHLGPYPMSFTTLNFLALDRLLPLVAEDQRRAIADLERDLARVHDAASRQQVQHLLEMERRHLAALQEPSKD